MRGIRRSILATLLICAAAATARDRAFAEQPDNGVPPASAGGGHYTITLATGEIVEMQFGFSAVVHKNGRATGQFHHMGLFQGQAVEFHGEVTCLSVDPDHHRAWIGGVITVNRSENPSFLTAVHEPGHDIWFRVLDADNGGSGEPDRTTFVGFEGVIPSSEAYCTDRPWPEGNARTWPVQGNPSVRP